MPVRQPDGYDERPVGEEKMALLVIEKTVLLLKFNGQKSAKGLSRISRYSLAVVYVCVIFYILRIAEREKPHNIKSGFCLNQYKIHSC